MKHSPLSNHTKALLVDMYNEVRRTDPRLSEADVVDIVTGEWNEQNIFPPDQLTREEVEAVLEEAKV